MATAISRFKEWREGRREEKWEKRVAAYKEARRTLYGPMVDHISFGLLGARPGTGINVPMVLPPNPVLVAYGKKMRRESETPEGQKRLDDLLEFLTREDEKERRSWKQQDQGDDKVL